MAASDWLDPNWRHELTNNVLGWAAVGVLSGTAAVAWFALRKIPSSSFLFAIVTGAAVASVFGGGLAAMYWLYSHRAPALERPIQASPQQPVKSAEAASAHVAVRWGGESDDSTSHTYFVEIMNRDVAAIDLPKLQLMSVRRWNDAVGNGGDYADGPDIIAPEGRVLPSQYSTDPLALPDPAGLFPGRWYSVPLVMIRKPSYVVIVGGAARIMRPGLFKVMLRLIGRNIRPIDLSVCFDVPSSREAVITGACRSPKSPPG